MRKIEKFKNWSPINEEAALRTLNTNEDYWLKKGKIGKKVALYTHDDMDGIFCAIEMKKWLLKHKFEIVKYGVVNYSEGWKYTTLDPTLINVVLDFANMPGDERDQHIDWYLDHHGLFSESDLEKYKNSPVKKMATSSAYEALCLALGISTDKLVLSPIDMIDAAKYGATEEEEPQIIRGEEKENKRQKIKVGNPKKYKVDWQRLLDFKISDIIKSENRRLEFAAAFNQFLKRSDSKTLISVINNCDDVSIYGIFNVMKKVYPEHNVVASGYKKGQKKDFIEDSKWRLGEMQKRTRGLNTDKKTFTSQGEFIQAFKKGNLIKVDGYQKIGDLVFVPTGTWANALRARSIVEKDILDGKLDSEPKFILLQYGGTLQVCSYKDMEKMKGELPVLKNGQVVNDLGKYMTDLLGNFQKHLGYYSADTTIGQDEITVSGGHGGIGSISNIFGEYEQDPSFVKLSLNNLGQRYVDMFKNKIISDLSGINFNLNLKWSEPVEFNSKEPEMDNKVIGIEDVTKMDKQGNIITKESKILKFNRFK